MQPIALICASVLVTALICPAIAAAERLEDGSGVKSEVVNVPVFPEAFFRDRIRIWIGSTFAPAAGFGDVSLGLARPDLRLRARTPVGDVLSLEMTADFSANLYDVDDDGALFEDCTDCPAPDDFYGAAVAVQSGYLLNRNWFLFRDDEHWALVGGPYLSARWAPGAFDESLSPGISVGVGYQLPHDLQLAVSVQVDRALDGGGVSVGPLGYLRWDFAPHFRLRTRGFGLQLEYRPTTRWELFVASLRTSDRFRLNPQPGAPAGMTFRDRQVTVGGGVVFKGSELLRFAAEAGAIVDRQVSVNARNQGRVDSADGDVSPYVSIRLELRP